MAKKTSKADDIKALKNLVDIQCTDGTWDNSPYMLGMANGLIIALSLLTGEDPEFKMPPDVYLSDLKELDKFNNSGIIVDNETD